MSKQSYDPSVFLANTAKLKEDWGWATTKIQLTIIHKEIENILDKLKSILFSEEGEMICSIQNLIKCLKNFVPNPFNEIYFDAMEKYLLANQDKDPFLKKYIEQVSLSNLMNDTERLKKAVALGYAFQQLYFADDVLQECIVNKSKLLNNPYISVKNLYLIVANSRALLAKNYFQGSFTLAETRPLYENVMVLEKWRKEENVFGKMRETKNQTGQLFNTCITTHNGYKDQFLHIIEQLNPIISKIGNLEQSLVTGQKNMNNKNKLILFSDNVIKVTLDFQNTNAIEMEFKKSAVVKKNVCVEFAKKDHIIEFFFYPDFLKQKHPDIFQTKCHISAKDQYNKPLTCILFSYPLNKESKEINLIHTAPEYLDGLFDILEKNYKLSDILKLDLKKPDEKQKFITNTGSLYYYLTQMAPCFRGSALVAHMFVSSIFLAKGLDLPNFKALDMEINPDIMAMLIPVDEFLSKYFAKVVENAIKPSSITNSATTQKLEKKNELH